MTDKYLLFDKPHPQITIARQAKLLGVSRAMAYYAPKANPEDERLMEIIDEIYTDMPFYGSRKILAELLGRGYEGIGRKRVCSLMRRMGIEAVFPGPNTSRGNASHKKYPYLLRGMNICQANQVWGTDITYIRLTQGFLYLVAIMDWFSRYVLSFRLSNTLHDDFCIDALNDALRTAKPEIHNSDQGVQFTSQTYTDILKMNGIRISMDGRGRALDNVFTERLWRSLKYEEVYLKNYESPTEAYESIKKYFEVYNHKRLHQSLNYQTPAEIYFSHH